VNLCITHCSCRRQVCSAVNTTTDCLLSKRLVVESCAARCSTHCNIATHCNTHSATRVLSQDLHCNNQSCAAITLQHKRKACMPATHNEATSCCKRQEGCLFGAPIFLLLRSLKHYCQQQPDINNCHAPDRADHRCVLYGQQWLLGKRKELACCKLAHTPHCHTFSFIYARIWGHRRIFQN